MSSAEANPPPPFAVEVRDVSRTFGKVDALTNLDIAVRTGSITVLLGPNGAGKTTAIRMITGALSPDSGSVSVFGLTPDSADGEEVRRRCGVVSAKPSLYDRLDGWDNLRYAAELYGLGKGSVPDARIAEAANQFGIDIALDQKVGGYSTGMKTRLALARAVLHEPDLLLLDEPTSGLDPESAVAVLELIREMTGAGQTVLMCTHLLLEAEGLADEVAIMAAGTSLLAGRPDDLSRQFWPNDVVRISAEDGRLLDRLGSHEGVISLSRDGDDAKLEVDHLDRVPQLIAMLAADGVGITSVVPFTPSLEDLYFAVRRKAGSNEGEVAPPADTTGRPVRTSRVAEMAK